MQKITFEDLPSTNTPINATNLNQLQTNVENGMPKKTLLWTNENPTSTFSGQITLSSDNYDELIWYFKETATGSILFSSTILKGYGTRLSVSFAPSDVKGVIYSRTITRTSDTLFNADSCNYFYASTSENGTNNNLCVPIYVYGIKY